MKVRLVWVGRTRDAAAAAWIETYHARIAHFAPIEIVETADAAGKGRARAARESAALAAKLRGRGLVVLLDEAGETMTSHAFAAFLETTLAARSGITFLLGGADGVDPALLPGVDRRLSLSPMTLPHELARVVLLEQIYRAFTILRGTPYHR